MQINGPLNPVLKVSGKGSNFATGAFPMGSKVLTSGIRS